MDAHTRKVYVPMTETGFYILFCLQKPNHGYGIVQMVEKLTDGEIRLSPGTMYGSLSKMEKDGLIRFINEEEKRKIYKKVLKPYCLSTFRTFITVTLQAQYIVICY